MIRAIALTVMRYAHLATDRMASEWVQVHTGTALVHPSVAMDCIAVSLCVFHFVIPESGVTTRMRVDARVSAGMESNKRNTTSTSTLEFE